MQTLYITQEIADILSLSYADIAGTVAWCCATDSIFFVPLFLMNFEYSFYLKDWFRFFQQLSHVYNHVLAVTKSRQFHVYAKSTS